MQQNIGRGFLDKLMGFAQDFIGSHMRLFWALFGLGAALCGLSTIANVCVGLNIADGGSRNCGSLTGNTDTLKMIVGLIIICLSVFVWFYGRRVYMSELKEKRAIKEADIQTQKAIYEASKVTPHDRSIAGRVVEDQIPFSLPIINPSELTNLKDLVGKLQDYASTSLSRKHRTEDVLLHDGSKQTIYTLGTTRFSTFFAVVSEQGSVLMIDRSKSKIPTTGNEHFDFFGSVGYENLSIREKLFNAPNYQELSVKQYKTIPGFAAENIYFTESGKHETAVMIGHLAIVSHAAIEAMRQSAENKNEELIIKGPSEYPDNTAMTAKAVLAIDYIRRNSGMFKQYDI